MTWEGRWTEARERQERSEREMLAAITYWRLPPNGPRLETSITMLLSEQWWNIDGLLNGLPYMGWPALLHCKNRERAGLTDERTQRRGVEGGTGRSQILVSTFTCEWVFLLESSSSSQVIYGRGDWSKAPTPPGVLAGDLDSEKAARLMFT